MGGQTCHSSPGMPGIKAAKDRSPSATPRPSVRSLPTSRSGNSAGGPRSPRGPGPGRWPGSPRRRPCRPASCGVRPWSGFSLAGLDVLVGRLRRRRVAWTPAVRATAMKVTGSPLAFIASTVTRTLARLVWLSFLRVSRRTSLFQAVSFRGHHTSVSRFRPVHALTLPGARWP